MDEKTTQNDRILAYAMEIQSIAQCGLAYCKDPYDRERYERLRKLAAEMVSERLSVPTDRIRDMFLCESGYQTPKVDTRAAVFDDGGRILLVHEKNGTWSLPGGWCDVDQSVFSNTEKEVAGETGLSVKAKCLIAVQDWRRHNVTNYLFGVVKTFVLCQPISGAFAENIETTEARYFAMDELPAKLAVEKTTRAQIEMCFAAYADPNWQVQCD